MIPALSLSGLYFVVTGIQFWVTDYMTTPVSEGGIGIDAGLVVLSFSLSYKLRGTFVPRLLNPTLYAA